MASKTRRKTRSETQKYIEKITNPRTSEDWTLAITDPLSPIYQLTMNIMWESAVTQSWLEEFIIRWIQRQQREERRETEMALQDAAAREVHKEQLQQQQWMKPPVEQTSTLAKQVAYLTAANTVLTEMKERLTQAIEQTDKSLQAIDQTWKTNQAVAAEEFMSQLDLEYRRDKVKEAFILTSPTDLLKMNPALIQQVDKTNPLQSTLTLAKNIANRFNFVRELNVMANALLDEFNPSAFLQKLKKFKSEKPSFNIPTCTPTDKGLICDAITGVCRRIDQTNELNAVNRQLKDNEASLTRLHKQLAELQPPRFTR